jgi:AcrR family transcriptional regulator
MSTPPARAPGRADAQRNRERVLEAVFAATGDLRDISLDDLAREAGVGRSTLYRHFPTREDLVLAANQRAIEEGHEMSRAAVAAGGSPAEVLTRLSRDVVRLAGRFRVLRAHRDVAARLVSSVGYDDPLMAWIVTAHAQGQLRDDLSPRWIATTLVALSMATADELALPGQDESEVAAMLARTLIGAFVAEA